MRLIDSDALIETLKNYAKEDEQKGGVMIACGSFVQGLAVACKLADTAETIVPVKHGQWITQYDLDGNIEYYECTNCNFALLWSTDDALPKYCPECGARMEGEKE